MMLSLVVSPSIAGSTLVSTLPLTCTSASCLTLSAKLCGRILAAEAFTFMPPSSSCVATPKSTRICAFSLRVALPSFRILSVSLAINMYPCIADTAASFCKRVASPSTSSAEKMLLIFSSERIAASSAI